MGAFTMRGSTSICLDSPPFIMSLSSRPADAHVPVWDLFVRVFHWSLVASVVAAWLTHEVGRDVHVPIGYVSLALVAARAVWGLVGSRYARFRDFVKGPGTVLAYLADLARGTERRYLGHNPAGGAMIVALLLMLVAVGVSGWMGTTETYWGEEWVEQLHEALAYGLLGLVALHLVGVVVASRRHRENLAAAMLSGRKRAATGDDVA